MKNDLSDSGTELLETVVQGGYCVGCGACAVPSNSEFKIEMNSRGMYTAAIDGQQSDRSKNVDYNAICPFSSGSAVEDKVGKQLFAADAKFDEKIGYHCGTYAGHVNEDVFREKGSSGGMGTWILVELLRKGLIDSVIHVGVEDPEADDSLFKMKISTSEDEIRQRSKSRYYPVEMSSVLREAIECPGKYALVGLPCFIKAFHRLAAVENVLNERVLFTVGIVCGHLKSKHFASMFAWQCGIPPGGLSSIDFRTKIDGQAASAYGISVDGKYQETQIRVTKTNRDFYGSNWGYGLLKYKACDYCDDVVAETADISVGDAWLPGYVEHSGGSNVVVVRNALVKELVEDAIEQGRLSLDRISPEEVAQSQEGGLRHRREGLAYRLSLADEKGEFRPPKRVNPSADSLTSRQNRIMELRMSLAEQSHEAFAEAITAGRFELFENLMMPLITKYEKLYQPNIFKRGFHRLRRMIADVTRPVRSIFR